MRRIVMAVTGLALSLAVGVGVGAEQAQDAAMIDKNMKAVGPAFGGVNKAVKGGMLADAKTSAEALSKAFVDTEAFFKSHGKADGVEWAQGAQKAADAVAAAASAEAATAAAGALGKFCQGCHAKYRDKNAEGGYVFKPGN
jgi:cytochrome c556